MALNRYVRVAGLAQPESGLSAMKDQSKSGVSAWSRVNFLFPRNLLLHWNRQCNAQLLIQVGELQKLSSVCGLDEVVANTLQQQANPSYEHWMARANVNSAMGQQWGATEALFLLGGLGGSPSNQLHRVPHVPKKGRPVFRHGHCRSGALTGEGASGSLGRQMGVFSM